MWLPIWFSARFLWALTAIALLLALSPGVAWFAPLSFALATVLFIATVVDALLGPRASRLGIVRTPAEHFSLAVATELTYAIENRSNQAVRVGLIETPLRTLRYGVDESIAALQPQSRVTIQRPVTPIARGSDELGTLYVWYENRLGLLRRRLRVRASQKIRIYPDLTAVERYGALHLRNRTIEAGLRRMKLRGIGTEFESLREWSDGDAFRCVNWKATARRGKLMATQYEVERSQNVMLLLDCGRLMTARIGERRKLDYVVQAALSVATVAGLASDRVGLVAFARNILAATAPRSTRSSIAGLTNALYGLEPRFEESNYTRAFAYLRHHLHKRSMIVFLTDVIDPIAQAAAMAEVASLARRHLLVCVFMNDAAVSAALDEEPRSVAEAYRYNVATGLQTERRTAKATLERTGALVIDVPAARLSTALIDEYLRVKRRGLL